MGFKEHRVEIGVRITLQRTAERVSGHLDAP
jgi:hypothetical protein